MATSNINCTGNTKKLN